MLFNGDNWHTLDYQGAEIVSPNQRFKIVFRPRHCVGSIIMRLHQTSGSLFNYVDCEERIPRNSCARSRQVVNDALAMCSIPNDLTVPLRSVLFMARSMLRELRNGARTC